MKDRVVLDPRYHRRRPNTLVWVGVGLRASYSLYKLYPGEERYGGQSPPFTAFFSVVDPLDISDAQRLFRTASASVHEAMVCTGQHHRNPL